MTRRNEPALWANTRTDPATYADEALAELRGAVRVKGAQLRGYIHDALLLAFEAGESQGEERALKLLLLARVRWSDDPLVEAALIEVISLLAPEIGDRLKPEGE